MQIWLLHDYITIITRHAHSFVSSVKGWACIANSLSIFLVAIFESCLNEIQYWSNINQSTLFIASPQKITICNWDWKDLDLNQIMKTRSSEMKVFGISERIWFSNDEPEGGILQRTIFSSKILFAWKDPKSKTFLVYQTLLEVRSM